MAEKGLSCYGLSQLRLENNESDRLALLQILFLLKKRIAAPYLCFPLATSLL